MSADDDLPPPPLRWLLDVREVAARGLTGERAASPEEKSALSQFLDLLAVNRFHVQYTLTPRSGGKARLRGSLSAEVEQACVLTRESIAAVVTHDFDVEFWPAEAIAAFEPDPETAYGADDPDPPEPLVDGRIDLGGLATELLAVNLDPYPRAPGAEFKPLTDDIGSASGNPFAVLSKLKSRGDAH